MPLRWTTTDQFSAEHGVKILIHSDAGVGKTFLCSTAPQPLILSAEAGLLSLRKFKLHALEIKEFLDLNDIYRFLTESREANNYWTVCLDSVSEIGEVVLANELKKAKDPRQAYGEMAQKLEILIKAYRDLPNKHVYFAAKQEPMKDDMTGIIKYAPSMPGRKMGPAIPYYFDEVFVERLHQNKDPVTGINYRYLQTQPDLQYVAKDRSGALATVEPPDLNYIINKIMGV